MQTTRWVLLGLYVALVLGLVLAEIFESGSEIPLLSLVTVGSLGVFIFGAGTQKLCRPIRRPRLVLPVSVAAFMMAVLAMGVTLAVGELIGLNESSGSTDEDTLFWYLLAASWALWSILLYVYTRGLQRYRVIYRLTKLVFAGSLAELLTTVPSHIYVEKRGGCFAGIATGLGVVSGMLVLFWSFGPGILLLFLKQAYERQTRLENFGRLDANRLRRFQFKLRTLLVITLATGIGLALLKLLWGQWMALLLACTLALLLLTSLLLWHSYVLVAAALLAYAGLFITLGEHPVPLVFLLAAAVIYVLLLRHMASTRADVARESASNPPDADRESRVPEIDVQEGQRP